MYKGHSQAFRRHFIYWVFLQMLIPIWETPIHSSRRYSKSPSSTFSDITFLGSSGCPHPLLLPPAQAWPSALAVSALALSAPY